MKSKIYAAICFIVLKIILVILYIYFPKAYRIEQDVESALKSDNLNGLYHDINPRK